MRAFFAAVLILAFVTGCSPGHEGTPTTKVVVDTPKGPVTFMVEMAADKPAREKGLMFRTKLAPNAGMLFDFQQEGLQVFWMKNTPLPLDMIFIKADGTISSIAENAVPFSEEPIPSSEPVRAVLEINAGKSRALGITEGEKVHAAIFGNGS
jgi:uncharacterized membrane protein (UPF0127 family)